MISMHRKRSLHFKLSFCIVPTKQPFISVGETYGGIKNIRAIYTIRNYLAHKEGVSSHSLFATRFGQPWLQELNYVEVTDAL